MAETATIDLISYSKNATGTSSAGTKAFSSKSTDFANVLSSANKSLYAQNSNANNKLAQNNTASAKITQNPTTNDTDKASNSAQKSMNSTVNSNSRQNNDKAANDSDKTQNVNSQPEKTQVENNKTDNTSKKPENKTDSSQKQPQTEDKTNTKQDSQASESDTTVADSTTTAPAENIEALTPATQSVQPEPQVPANNCTSEDSDKKLPTNSDAKTEDKAVNTNINTANLVENTTTIAIDNSSNTKIAEDKKNDSVTTLPNEQNANAKNIQKNDDEKFATETKNTEAPVTPVLTTTAETVIDMLTLNQQAQSETSNLTNQNTDSDNTQNVISDINQLEDINSNFQIGINTKNTGDSNSITNQNLINTAQQANTQISNNLDQGEQNISLVQTASTQQSEASSDAISLGNIDSSNTPSIKVNTEAIASTINANDTNVNAKQNENNGATKTTLTQDILNKTNATVESVETSNSSSGSNLNSHSNSTKGNQNTEDQMAKLALQDDTQNDMANINGTQSSFGNTLDSLQATVTSNQTFGQSIGQTQAQTSAQAPKTISNTEIMSQINKKLDNLSMKDEGTSKITIVLKPENLGKINLELINSKEGLTAQLTTNNSQVKEILDKTLDNLKENLSNQGINVNSVTVKVETTQKSSNDMLSFENHSGQSEENSQNQSGNSNQADQSSEQGSFSNSGRENIDSISENEFNNEAETMSSEKHVSIGSGSRKVDYKI